MAIAFVHEYLRDAEKDRKAPSSARTS
jgi:hypothetical protein